MSVNDIADALGNPSGFNTAAGPGMDDYSPIPAGTYTVVATKAETLRTRAGDGYYLKLQFTVADGEYTGRVLFHQINLANPNPKAVEIGHKELTSFGQAVGVPVIASSTQCVNVPLLVKVKIKDDPNYGPQNAVSGFFPLGNQAPAPVAPQTPPPQARPQTPPPPAAAAPRPAMPWKQPPPPAPGNIPPF